MNRLSFLKKLGFGIGIVAVAPKLLAEKTPNRDIELSKYLIDKNARDIANIPNEIIFDTYHRGYPEYYGELVKRYGKEYSLFDFINAISLKNP